MTRPKFAAGSAIVELEGLICGLFASPGFSRATIAALVGVGLAAGCGLSDVGPDEGKLAQWKSKQVVIGDVGTCKLTACQAQDRCLKWGCTTNGCEQLGAVNCDDGVECTDDSCSVSDGCQWQPFDHKCDDGNVCTVGKCDAKDDCSFLPTAASCTDGGYCDGGVCK